MAPSLLEQAQRLGFLELVDMDVVKVLPFGTSGPKCLGANDLSSCTVVAIVSRAGAILAHIAPRQPDGDPYEASGDDHAVMMMDCMKSALKQHQNRFHDQGAYSIVIYGVYQGAVALEDQVGIISRRLASWGLPPRYVGYEVLPASQRGPAGGTVLVDGRGSRPVVWVEDRRVA